MAFGFASYKDWQMRNEKFCINCYCGMNFFYHHPSFSLVKAAMSAPRICKFRKDCLTGTSNDAMVLSKRLHFIIFQLLLAEQRPLHTCQLRRGVFEADIGALQLSIVE
jgi:hypothetical protein